MAALIKRGTRWYVKYYDANGDQKWVKAYSDKTESRLLANRLEDEKTKISRGEFDAAEHQRIAQRKRSLAEHIAEYRSHLTAAGRSDNHVAYTIGDIERFARASRAMTAAAITRTMVDAWVIQMGADDKSYRAWLAVDARNQQQGEPNSPRTINRRVGSLQAFLKWAVGVGAVNTYPLHRYPKQEIRGKAIRKSRPLTQKEAAELVNWCKANAPERAELYQFAIQTGCRANECASLTDASFDLAAPSLTVQSKDTRRTDRIDTVPLNPELVPVVRRRIEAAGEGGRIFTLPDHPAETLRRDCEAAGIKSDSVSFHGLRHTFVTILARAGVHPTIAQKLARHRDIAMTLGYYTHWATDDEKKALTHVRL